MAHARVLLPAEARAAHARALPPAEARAVRARQVPHARRHLTPNAMEAAQGLRLMPHVQLVALARRARRLARLGDLAQPMLLARPGGLAQPILLVHLAVPAHQRMLRARPGDPAQPMLLVRPAVLADHAREVDREQAAEPGMAEDQAVVVVQAHMADPEVVAVQARHSAHMSDAWPR